MFYRKVKGLYCSLLLVVGACTESPQQTSSYPQNPAVSDAQGTPHDTTTFYFPAADSLHATYLPKAKRPAAYVVDERVKNCAAELVSASYCLTYFDAPVLSNYYLQTPIYRFLWLRSFHRPVLLTLCRTKTGATLRTQLLDKFPGFETVTVLHPDSLPASASPARRARTKRFYEETMADSAFQARVAAGKRRAEQVQAEKTMRVLTTSEYQAFEHVLQQARFWELPSCHPRPGLSLDGASWLLEAHLAKRYHLVERASPKEGDPFRQVCEYLLDLSSVCTEERY
jgi:hypothetical protein